MGLVLSRDGWLLFATCGVRSFAYGFLSVVLGLYLDAIGLTTTAIGWIFTAALAGGLLTGCLAAAAGVLVSLRASTVRQAAQTLSIGIMLCIFVPAFGIPALPTSWKASLMAGAMTLSIRQWVALAAGILVLADAIMLAAAMARFKRARLILD